MFFFSSRRRHTRYWRDWSSDVCSSDLALEAGAVIAAAGVANALQGASERDGCHGERAVLRGWRAVIHVLNALSTGVAARGVEVNSEVAERLEHGSDLQIDRKSVV